MVIGSKLKKMNTVDDNTIALIQTLSPVISYRIAAHDTAVLAILQARHIGHWPKWPFNQSYEIQ